MFILKTDVLLSTLALTANNSTLIGLTSEYGFRKRNSLQLTVLHDNFKRATNPIQHFTTNFIMLEYKFFFSQKRSFTGFYSGPNGQYIFEHEKYSNVGGYVESKDMRIGGGLIIGYQNYIRKRLTVDFFFGMTWGYLVQKTIVKEVGITKGFSQTVQYGRAAINIGYRF